jgi:hypothetical protein
MQCLNLDKIFRGRVVSSAVAPVKFWSPAAGSPPAGSIRSHFDQSEARYLRCITNKVYATERMSSGGFLVYSHLTYSLNHVQQRCDQNSSMLRSKANSKAAEGDYGFSSIKSTSCPNESF